MKKPTYAELVKRIKTLQKEVAAKTVSTASPKLEYDFQTFTEQSPNMIFINKGGRVVYANKKCVETMGYSPDEFYAPEFDFLSLIAPESIELIRTNFKRHLNGEDVEPYE
jgi:PAS domain S-box-containing protein